jgi:membrane protease YdiL (CAAX protease family)
MALNRNNVLGLAVFTLFVFPLLGMLFINLFTSESIQVMIRGKSPIHIQVGLGLVVGLVMGLISLFVSTRNFIKCSPRYQELKVLFRGLRLSVFDCVLISIAVGFGEELFFRGAIQYLANSASGSYMFGIVFTSVFFVVIHRYISLKDWRISVYGIVMVFFIIILGYMTEYIGIWSAAAAHSMIDFVLLVQLEDEPVPDFSHLDEEE